MSIFEITSVSSNFPVDSQQIAKLFLNDIFNVVRLPHATDLKLGRKHQGDL